MKEVIETVLNDETLTTNDERIEAISKSLATLMIPKDKFNEVNAKLKTTESNYSTLSNEFNEFKQSKMTADEKQAEQLKQLEADKQANALTKSKLAVKELLLDNGIKISDDDVELKETLENIVSEDYDKSIKLANNFISLLNKTKENTQKQITTDLLNGTPKPNFGNPNAGTVSNYDAYKAKYDEAVKNNDFLGQATYMRMMQEEQAKKTIK